MATTNTQCCSFLRSSIGKKWVVAVTGLILVGFLAAHLAGNLLIYVGQDALNEYAAFLHHLLHGTGIWIARAVLLTSIVAHIVATVQLTVENRKAREQKYAIETTQQASSGSKWMIWSGLVILTFVVFHILHYTVRVGAGFDQLPPDAEGRFDVYRMVVLGFSNLWVSLFYILSIGLLCSHLSHGVASLFQTLGLTTPKTRQPIQLFAYAYTAIIFIGNISIPIAVLTGLVS